MLDCMPALMGRNTDCRNRRGIINCIRKSQCLVSGIIMVRQISCYVDHLHIIDTIPVKNLLSRLASRQTGVAAHSRITRKDTVHPG